MGRWMRIDLISKILLDKPILRQFFIRFHGGEGSDKCCWAGCNGNVLVEKLIFVNHAYPEYAPE